MKIHALLLTAALPALSFAQRQPAEQATPKQVFAPVPPKATKLKWVTAVESKGSIGAIGDTVPIKATLKSKTDGKPFGRKTLSFSIAGRNVGSATTDANGEAKLSYKVPNDPRPGSVPLTISFAGDDDCSPSAVTVNFAVFKSSTKITLDPPSTHVNEGEKMQVIGTLVRITDQRGVQGREILVAVNGKPAGKTTTFNTDDGKFIFNYQVPSPFPPKAGVEVRFEGDDLYNPTVAKTEFAVKNPVKQAYLFWSDAKGRVGETITLRATLTSSSLPLVTTGGIGGQRVRVHYSGGSKLCEATTNSLGVAKCSTKLDGKVGSYALAAHADVNRDEWTVESVTPAHLTRLIVAPSPVRLALSGPSSARIGTRISVRVRLTRTTDSAPIANAWVALQGSGSEKTDANGGATFDVTIGSAGGTGPHTIKATFAGNPEKYEKGEGSITVNVLPSVN